MSDETHYERTVLIAVKVSSKNPIDDSVVGWIKDALVDSARCVDPQMDDILTVEVEPHTCPKVAAGTVDAAFKRIDALEERIVKLLETFVCAAEVEVRGECSRRKSETFGAYALRKIREENEAHALRKIREENEAHAPKVEKP